MITVLPVAARNAALRIGAQARHGRPATADECARMLANEAVRALRRTGARG